MLKHILGIFFTILLLVIFALGKKTHYQVVNGYWTGTINTGKEIVHVAFNISTDGCVFDCREQKAYGVNADVLYRNHDSICIDIPSLNAQTKLTIIQKNGRMKGLFRQDGKTHPIDIGLNDIRIRRRQ